MLAVGDRLIAIFAWWCLLQSLLFMMSVFSVLYGVYIHIPYNFSPHLAICIQCNSFHPQFVATAFQARTRVTHKEHCSMLQGALADHVATTYGLTRDSILNQSRYFHVTEGLPPDCMHDLLEGTMQYEIKELLKSLTQRGFISLQDINCWIALFPYSACDAVNKPSPVSLSSADHSLKQTGL